MVVVEEEGGADEVGGGKMRQWCQMSAVNLLTSTTTTKDLIKGET